MFSRSTHHLADSSIERHKAGVVPTCMRQTRSSFHPPEYKESHAITCSQTFIPVNPFPSRISRLGYYRAPFVGYGVDYTCFHMPIICLSPAPARFSPRYQDQGMIGRKRKSVGWGVRSIHVMHEAYKCNDASAAAL